MQIDQQSLTFILAIAAVGSIVFQVYNSWRSPQIATDQTTISLRQDIINLKGEIKEIKETHLRTLEAKMETLNGNISTLSGTVIKLATIIDERIPKGSPNLTPPGN